jgi:hypothetical protein
MEFKEIIPEDENWITQKALYVFENIRLGSLIAAMDEDGSVIYGYEINGYAELLPDECKTWEEAEIVFLDLMYDYFYDQEHYYNDLKLMCNELIQERN